ncbi:Na+/H+ antiporter subunit E [Micromonospora inyonensis]|uniref:Multisubunit sodium/proton antiporter, MrpE subunit n=1 Tax=Micromonospora inyonensis TaxID=47866 RepID=A0A1C6SQG2_9ACTN|nr:Na+/H+ antiporter subunit E [Micromonospora inyonensis]SCL31826.1 multisubunit sodium/proton antiporter, MrpE subunit [Micromonospora inyonensis]
MIPDPPVPGSGPRRRLVPGAAPGRARAARWRERLIAAAWMVLIWNLFWGRFTLGNLVGGCAVAAVVLVFFPLPPVSLESRLRPVHLLRFGARFAAQLVSASIHVAWVAVRPRYRPRSAIIAVRLRVRTDLNLALTAEVLSLVPGSLIIDVDRSAGLLYVHVLDVRGPEDLRRARWRIEDVERRIVRVVGSPAEVRLLAGAPVEKGTAT